MKPLRDRQIGVLLSAEQAEQVELLAREQERSVSSVVRESVAKLLAEKAPA